MLAPKRLNIRTDQHLTSEHCHVKLQVEKQRTHHRALYVFCYLRLYFTVASEKTKENIKYMPDRSKADGMLNTVPPPPGLLPRPGPLLLNRS